MKICYICADPGIPIFGRKGCATHVRETCRALRDLGHDVRIVGSNFEGEALPEERQEAIAVEPYRSRRLGFDVRNILLDRRMKRAVAKLADDWQPDVIYERYSLYSTAGTWAGRRFNLPRVIEVNAFLTRELQGRIRVAPLARAYERRILRAAPRIIVVSEPLRQEITELGVPREHITKMPMAVNLELFHAAREENHALRESLGLKDRFVIGYVGTLAGWHGLTLLFDVAQAMRESQPAPFTFLVVGGEGEKLEHNRNLAREAGLSDLMQFIGSVPYEQVPRYLNTMDAAIVPDTTYWSSPAKMFEYQATGLPVLAPSYPAVLEAITDGVEGILYAPRNITQMTHGALRLMKHPEQRAAMGRAARARAERDHSWNHNARAIMELYASMGVAIEAEK